MIKKIILFMWFLCISIFFIVTIGFSSIIDKDFYDKLDKEINYGYNIALKQYPSITEYEKKYCNGKLNVAIATYVKKESGASLEEILQIMKNGYLAKPEEKRVAHYRYLEYERMARTIYRHSDQPFSELFLRFYDDCMALKF